MISICRNPEMELSVFPQEQRDDLLNIYLQTNTFSWNEYDKKIVVVLHSYTDRRCNYCGKKIESGQIDHLYPKNKDAFPEKAYDFGNFFISCVECNNNRHNKHSEFLTILRELIFFRPDNDYVFSKYYRPNFKTGEIEIKEAELGEEEIIKAKNTINIVLKLNREYLVNSRKDEFEKRSFDYYEYFFKDLKDIKP